MADAYLFSEHAVKQLQRNHDALRLEVQQLNARIESDKGRPWGTELRQDAVFCVANETITARSSATLGTGEANIHQKDPRGTASNDTGLTADIYNVSDSAISSGDYFRAVRDFKTGDWLAEAGAAGTTVTADISYVKAEAYWTYTGSAYPSTTSAVIASVQVKKCDLDGTVDGSAFTCLLPITNTGNDPNVVTGQIFTAAKFTDPSDDAETWAALSGHEDAAIGVVRMLTGNFPANDATGWAEMDGNQTAGDCASGSAINFAGRIPIQGTVGAHAGTVGASTTSGSTSGATGSTTPDTGTTSSTAVSVNITGASVATDTSETDIESTDEADAGTIEVTTETLNHDSAGPDETDVVTELTGHESLEHTHTIPDPGHEHDVTGTFSGTADAHTHTVAGDPHTHTVTAHTHTIEQMGTCGVKFYERVDNSA